MAKKEARAASPSATNSSKNHHRSSSSSSCKNDAKMIRSAIRFVAAAALFIAIIIGVNFKTKLSTTIGSFSSTLLPTAPPSTTTKSREDIFLTWFTQNGGIFHPIRIIGDDNDTNAASSTAEVQISIRKFDNLGWGLAAVVNTTATSSFQSVSCNDDSSAAVNNENQQETSCPSSTPSSQQQQQEQIIIPHLTPLFTVPSHLIISISSILDMYSTNGDGGSSLYLPNFYDNVNKILLTAFPHGQGLARMSHNSNSYGIGGGGVRMGMVEQDVVIAMFLMVEDCLHSNNFLDDDGNDGSSDDGASGGSFWGPYLDMLPSQPIPRLDTFDDRAYKMLNDNKLEMMGRSSLHQLKLMFHGGGGRGGRVTSSSSSLSVKSVVNDMIQVKLSKKQQQQQSPLATSSDTEGVQYDVPQQCLQFDTFHKFVGIVSSRAMVLKGVKYLSPLAEMINYKPVSPLEQVGQQQQQEQQLLREDDVVITSEEQKREEHDWIRTPFDLYHTIGDDDSITVRSDRNVMLHEQRPTAHARQDDNDNTDDDDKTTTIQIFEDYGPVDSSLFLEMHAFVPTQNPNNCAVIHGQYFLRRQVALGRYDSNTALLLHALKLLRLINPHLTSFVSLEDVCVRSDLSIVEDGKMIGRRPASDAIAIMSLLLRDGGSSIIEYQSQWDDFLLNEYLSSLKSKCIAAIESNDVERIELLCARYPGSKSWVVKDALINAARRSVESTTAASSMDMLRLWLEEAERDGDDQLVLALRFRIEERKILESIAEHPHDDSLASMVDNESSVPNSKDDLAAKISSFNAFIDSLNLPVNKIQAAQAPDGMRLGTVATEDLELDEVYISLPPHAVIDTASALADAAAESSSSPHLVTLLNKLDTQSRQQPQQLGSGDGFDVLLVYLLHERFVRKEQSKWWPYLDILPTVHDMKTSHPLFFDEDEMNKHLGGSDVRKSILRNQQRAFERHAALSSDVDVHLVLGSDIVLDKNAVYWATAIIDSRSIWWDGRRHLCPLLDLVNADTIGRAHETTVEEASLAVTRASRPVTRGDFIFENYQQPNHLLFAFHGFVLDYNPIDCALLRGLTINHNDPGAKYASHLQSSSFCISGDNIDSMEELAKFLQIKHGLDVVAPEDPWLDNEVVPFLIHLLEERIARLDVAWLGSIDLEEEDESIPQRVRFMSRMRRSDLAHFQGALELLKERS